MSQATTAGGLGENRKISSHTEPDHTLQDDMNEETKEFTVIKNADSDEESSEEEYKEGGSQKFITPNDVEKHLKKLWESEHELLGLMYGRFDPTKTEDNKIETQGVCQFFIRKVIVPPIRFRPESEGNLGGGGGSSGDKAYLHTHSAMLTKVIQRNTMIA